MPLSLSHGPPSKPSPLATVQKILKESLPFSRFWFLKMALAAAVTSALLGMGITLFILRHAIDEKEIAMDAMTARTVETYAELTKLKAVIAALKEQRTQTKSVSVQHTGAIMALEKQLVEQQEKTVVWQQRSIDLEKHSADLEQQNALLRHRLDGTYVATEIRGMADFPVLRGMSRRGDTVETFAKREGTTAEVILALNPWLRKRKKPLVDYQTVWIPRPAPP